MRFWLTNLIALPTFLAIGYFMRGWPRIGVFTIFWTVYLTILGCGIVFQQLQFFGPVIRRGKAGQMRVALTFDDGPDPNITPALLELLEKEKIPAAFFCIGKHVDAHPHIARQIVETGHLIGNHTFNHAWYTPLMMTRRLRDELSRTQDAIMAATGIAPAFMRPPVGHTNPHYPRVLRQLKLQLIGWDVRSMDTLWPIERVVAHVLQQAKDGSIILLHDGGRSPGWIEHVMEPIIAGLRERGYQFVRLDEMLNQTRGASGHEPINPRSETRNPKEIPSPKSDEAARLL